MIDPQLTLLGERFTLLKEVVKMRQMKINKLVLTQLLQILLLKNLGSLHVWMYFKMSIMQLDRKTRTV